MQKSVKEIFELAAKAGASDVHLAVGQPPLVRIDGELHVMKDADPIEEADTQEFASDLLVKSQLEKFYNEKELDTAYELDGQRYRVNFHWALGKIAVAARVLKSSIPSMEELLMPEVMYSMIKPTAGLILVTGPTGHGKTTNMVSMIEHINERYSKHVVTLEDPVEYVFTSKKCLIKQREYGTDFLSFPEGLKRVLRQDPDIIMVGEMRDPETMAAAITLAETGHLVFATLHTNNGPETIDRIVDTFPPYQQTQIRMQLSLILKAVTSQRLVPKIGGGRIAAREIMVNTNAVSNLIRENKIAQLHTVIETGSRFGMIPLERALKNLVDQGLVSEEAIQPHINMAEVFKIEG